MKGENLKFALEKKGITQRKLADILGCSVNTVWRWCNDKQEVSDKIKKRLSEILGVPVSYLMGESGDSFLKIYDINNLPKELAPYFGVTEPESGANLPVEQEYTRRVVDEENKRSSPSAQPAFERRTPDGGGLPDNRIIIETSSGKDMKRYILPATSESYDFLKRLNESESEMTPEKSAILKIMEDMTQEEIKAMFDFLSAKRT